MSQNSSFAPNPNRISRLEYEVNLEQKLAKCNQAIDALAEVSATLWQDTSLRDLINEASGKITEAKALLRLRQRQETRAKELYRDG